MRLPDFVVIGAKKAGSTWLDRVLRSHSAVALPAARKEIAYFDLFHDRGLEWYGKFFEHMPHEALLGESTPEYMHHPDAPAYIERDLPRARLIAVLRNPIDRAYSEWSHQVMRFAETRSFEAYIREEPALLAKSEYPAQLRRFPRALAERRMHIVVLEEALQDPQPVLDGLGAYLGIDAAGFSARTHERQNETYEPRFRRGFALARTFSDWLRAQEFDAVANLAQKLGARRLFGHRGRFAPMSAEQRASLSAWSERVTGETEQLLGRTIAAWRGPTATPTPTPTPPPRS